MKKYISIFVLLLLLDNFSHTQLLAQQQRQTVGLVLSGGGAKGVAHIGVLKVLEEEGIPIDYIAGTSMGAIIGALYSIGYTSSYLDSLVRVQDWVKLLSDKVSRSDQPFSVKDYNEKYLLSFPFGKVNNIKIPAGVISGQNIFNLFSDLTVGYHDVTSFNNLPIPFKCVAANIVDGTEVVLDKGSLPSAMRASMAIPGAFAPVVTSDSMILVDGGVINNFPVDIAKKMGADVVIGVDLATSDKDFETVNTLNGLIEQLTALMGKLNYEKNLKNSDVYLNPVLNGYSAASFTREAIDTMIQRGEQIARLHIDEIRELKKKIGLSPDANNMSGGNANFAKSQNRDEFVYVDKLIIKGADAQSESWVRNILDIKSDRGYKSTVIQSAINRLYATGMYTSVSYALNGDDDDILVINLKEKPSNSLNIGFRFDSEDMASILLNTTFGQRAFKGSKMSITGRLSKNPYGRLDYSFGWSALRNVGISYMFKYNDLNMYYNRRKLSNISFSQHVAEISLSGFNINNFRFSAGLRWEFFDNSTTGIVVNGEVVKGMKTKAYYNYFLNLDLETFNQKYYPEHGLSFNTRYVLYTDNFTKHLGGKPFSSIAIDFDAAVRLTRRVYFMPSISGRVLIGDEIPFPYMNLAGGDMPARYMRQQISFAGIRNVEIFNNSLLVFKSDLRYRLGSRHYINLAANMGLTDDNFFDIIKVKPIWGGLASYSYNTMVGPVGVNVDISSNRKRMGLYVFFGYYF